ncbi:MAG: 30S ribosomal protein S20, partial [Vulcanimicrobiaceae bacterium]
MPNIKAAEKWVRQSDKRALRNRDLKTRLKTLFKKARTNVEAAVVSTIESGFDKAASKGVIHKNKAARKKARLAKAVLAARIAAAAPAPAPKAAGTGRGKSGKK